MNRMDMMQMLMGKAPMNDGDRIVKGIRVARELSGCVVDGKVDAKEFWRIFLASKDGKGAKTCTLGDRFILDFINRRRCFWFMLLE